MIGAEEEESDVDEAKDKDKDKDNDDDDRKKHHNRIFMVLSVAPKIQAVERIEKFKR